MSAPPPITTRPAHRVRVPDGEVGVRLEVAPRARAGERPVVCGAFRVARKDPIEPRAPRHRSIGMVVQFPAAIDAMGRAVGAPHAFTPFASTVLFADDEVDTPAHAEGWFAVDVWALFGDDFPRIPFSMFAVLGVHASNVLEIPL